MDERIKTECNAHYDPNAKITNHYILDLAEIIDSAAANQKTNRDELIRRLIFYTEEYLADLKKLL